MPDLADPLVSQQGSKNAENLSRFELGLPGHKRRGMTEGDKACAVPILAEGDADKAVPERVSACCFGVKGK